MVWRWFFCGVEEEVVWCSVVVWCGVVWRWMWFHVVRVWRKGLVWMCCGCFRGVLRPVLRFGLRCKVRWRVVWRWLTW